MENSRREVFRDPVRAWELARLAHSVAIHIDPRTCGGKEAVCDLDACALAMEGNALRVRGKLREAVAAFADARVVQKRGGVDLDLAVTIDLMESSLRRELWQLGWALALIDRATGVALSLEQGDRIVQAAIGRANVYLVSGDWTKAAVILRSALDSALDLRFECAVRHNLADTLLKAGCPHEAARIFSATRDLYARCADPLTDHRRLWLEGLIARELDDDLQHALALLELATEYFIAHGYAVDAALAQLDLVATRKKQADRKRARRRRPSAPQA
jgi:tetratricopeptide (TPR) repeat protein